MRWFWPFFVCFILVSCGIAQSSKTSELMTTPPSLAYLALGDSYTIGESANEFERWPLQLTAALRARGIVIGDPTIIARTGWTTDELNDAIDKAELNGTYDVVSLLIGVNNQYRGRTAENYREEFRGLLKRAIGFAGNRPQRVVVLSIPDWGVTPFAEGRDRKKIAREIDDFNTINFEETVRAGAQYVDVTPISREAVRDPSLLAADGLHPSGKMYAAWAQLAETKFLKALEQ